ncbi:hypothetical protein FISHEDRAFT_59739 [Fistulina hepatica ATCC 64428]|uniref:Uncharacterized protein n=1 Tax=Fistulina hepatica ATCC 64428 TaxID=1128425 RepID=A0A0D7A961_9AGAR|nr:hypothetical protein FISHEDRAFT_59739 [Fistulina hepatica ATCC 64428]
MAAPLPAAIRFMNPLQGQIRHAAHVVQQVICRDAPRRTQGWTTHELYETVITTPIDKRFKIQKVVKPVLGAKVLLSHPVVDVTPTRDLVPSVNFLKRSVMPILRSRFLVKMACVERKDIPAVQTEKAKKQSTQKRKDANVQVDGKVWVWKYIGQRPPTLPVPALPRLRFGHEVGVGEDFSHLSRRRGRSRVAKVSRALETMKTLRATRATTAKTKREGIVAGLTEMQAKQERRAVLKQQKLIQAQVALAVEPVPGFRQKFTFS